MLRTLPVNTPIASPTLPIRIGAVVICSHVAGDRICRLHTANSLIFIKKDIYCHKLNFGTYTVQAMQNDFNFVIFCLSCYINWYCGGIISSSFRIYIHSLRIRIAVKFHKHELGLPNGCMHSATLLSSTGAPLGRDGLFR